jgi:replicative DNA helicase
MINKIHSEDHLGKLPPNAIELEEVVLGAVLIEPDCLDSIIDFFKPEIFYLEKHRIIIDAILSLKKKDHPIDILTVTEELQADGTLIKAGGPFAISELTGRVASSANVEYHIAIIYQKFMRRALLNLGQDIIRGVNVTERDVFDIIEEAQNLVEKVADLNFVSKNRTTKDVVKDSLAKLDKAMALSRDGKTIGVSTPFKRFNDVTGGFQPTDLIVLAGRPGMGKTAFVISLIKWIAVLMKKKLDFYSLEMSDVQVMDRLIASVSGVSLHAIRNGKLNADDLSKVQKAASEIDEYLLIDDTPDLHIRGLESKAKKRKKDRDTEMIVVDYLQLMDGDGDSREQKISDISRRGKILAKKLDLPVIYLAQLNRGVEMRANKKPMLSDLRESGAIEQDADMVVFLFRPDYYDMKQDDNGVDLTGKALLMIAKHRNGELRNVVINFEAATASFVDEKEDDPFDEQTEEADF